MKILNTVALVLLIVGGLNWALFAFADVDLVAGLFNGPDTIMSKIVYGLVGLAAVYSIFAMRPISHVNEDYAHLAHR